MREHGNVFRLAVVPSVIVLVAAACSDSSTTRVLAPGSANLTGISGPIGLPGDRAVQLERLEICKDYAQGSTPPALTDFTVSSGTTSNTVSLADGECREVWQEGALTADAVTVTESVPNGFTASYVVTTLVQSGTPQVGPPTAGNSVTVTIGGAGVPGALVEFTNTPVAAPALGRMTGGGFTAGPIKVTGGLTLHCDITLSNNLEINWNKNKWHLDKPITKATCIDDPAFDPKPPVAPFDTFIGEGLGEYNGVAGALAKFTFIDAGEPGNNDMVKIQIWDAGGTLVLDLPLTKLTNGNLQAHYDQPHGGTP